MRKNNPGLLAGIVLAALASAAHAEVEEITVSAERRDASLQEVPIAVSAFSSDDIQKLSIDITSDLGAAVPNMQTYQVTSNASAMQVFMRGAGIQNPGFIASESPVGIYVDDITAAAWPQPTWTLPISSASKCSAARRARSTGATR